MEFTSLFAGIGGFDLALERAGLKCYAQVEKDIKCQQVLARHFPNAWRHDDVCTYHPIAPIDILCGGFPCQDVSVGGRRAGLAGARSGLFFEFMRIAGASRPTWIILENVPGLLTSAGGRDMGAVTQALGELGYGWAYRVLDAQFVGVPQRRRRVFIVAHSSGSPRGCSEILLEPEGVPWNPAPMCEQADYAAGRTHGSPEDAGRVAYTLTAGSKSSGRRCESDFNIVRSKWWDGGDQSQCLDVSVIAKQQMLPEKNRFAAVLVGSGSCAPPTASDVKPVASHTALSASATTLIAGAPGHTRTTNTSIKSSEESCLQGPLVVSQNQRDEVRLADVYPAVCCSEGSTGRSHSAITAPDWRVRRITPIECERLQGFPDNWTDGHSDTARYHMLGNAVAVPVVEWIARRLVACHNYYEGESDVEAACA